MIAGIQVKDEEVGRKIRLVIIMKNGNEGEIAKIKEHRVCLWKRETNPLIRSEDDPKHARAKAIVPDFSIY